MRRSGLRVSRNIVVRPRYTYTQVIDEKVIDQENEGMLLSEVFKRTQYDPIEVPTNPETTEPVPAPTAPEPTGEIVEPLFESEEKILKYVLENKKYIIGCISERFCEAQGISDIAQKAYIC